MVIVEIPIEEIIKELEELREETFALTRKAENIWCKMRATVKKADIKNASGKADSNDAGTGIKG